MPITKNSNSSSIYRFWNVIRHGLFLHGITNRLARIGIEIVPYYWVREGVSGYNAPKIKGDSSGYSVKYLDLEEVEQICRNMPGLDKQEMLNGMAKGQLCMGLMHHKKCAAFMFVELNDFVFKKKAFKLANNEAYLLNMWTFNTFRGRNLAPYLRYQCYLLLAEMGRSSTFSITAYFNKSSIRFKEKLHAQNLWLCLHIGFFKKLHWNFMLKRYSK
ncbi:hypothetical protein [Ulvibacterium marinum]|uniref:GNAT family N-acetyltransferase n=1 Tax=Ulvibacterium marinum TaxID=2419782 RepID=A0A3B0CB97_9FLAO|nr:hypothetical protein [Ulvibacterium marinum]RKN81319.1 hypothetical protein D7Z94_10300 [Ulvibacterium marinum]